MYLEQVFLPWCGFQEEWLKRKELSDMTQIDTQIKSYQDSDILESEDIEMENNND